MIHEYKNAVIYCLNVETFLDSNGDGVGDFVGLTDRLPYRAGLGVTCLWLLPFFPSPNLDADDSGRHLVQLEPYGYRWFRIGDLERPIADQKTLQE